MIRLVKVPYDVNSPHGGVQACLRKKQEVARTYEQGGVHGISSGSCCAYVEYLDESGNVDNVFGNSRVRMPFFKSTVQHTPEAENRTACYHGELSALWHVLEADLRPENVLSLYIEMSPCGKCKSALDNILGDKEVLYSFDYHTESAQWVEAANRLCRAA